MHPLECIPDRRHRRQRPDAPKTRHSDSRKRYDQAQGAHVWSNRQAVSIENGRPHGTTARDKTYRVASTQRMLRQHIQSQRLRPVHDFCQRMS